MKDIKEKVKEKKPKIRNPASRLPKELVRSAVLEAKEKSRELPGRAGAGTGEESPTEYAGNKIEAAETASGSSQTGQGKDAGNVSRKRDTAQVRIKEKQKGKAGVQAARQSARTAKTTARGIKAVVEAVATTVKAALAALMAGGGAVLIILILIVGIIGGAAFMGNSQSAEPLSAEVLAHTPTIQRYASEYGIPEYVAVIQAIMMQESGGRGTDPMQSSECPYNTEYPNSPGAIQDADYSIKVGIQYYADCIREAGCESPQDMDRWHSRIK